MQIVIDIPEEVHNIVTEEGTIYGGGFAWLMNSVANGVVLPEGHGRLIDADGLKDVFKYTEDADVCKWSTYGVTSEIDDAPTIIEAESEG